MKKELVYADNAATTKLSPLALDAMGVFLREEYANASQPYAFARVPKQALKKARKVIAECIGAEPDEIIFTSCGTESDNWVIQDAAFHKRTIYTSSIEHHAILNSCAFAHALGTKVKYLPVDANGIVLWDGISKQLCSNDIMSIMFANNEIGTIEPIKEIAQFAHEYGCIFHTDAVQAVGHVPINVKELGIDLLSASAHKFNGPKGIGFLYIKRGIHISPFIYGGAQENGLRAGTENIASIVGMAAALKENVDALEENIRHIRALEDMLFKELSAKKIIYHRNGSEYRIPGNISLSFPNADGEALLHRLDFLGICVSTGSACDSKNTQISHVLKAIGLEKQLAKGTIRISLGKNNTEEDIDKIVSALDRISKR